MTLTLVIVLMMAIAAGAAMCAALREHHSDLRGVKDIEGTTSPVDLASFARITNPRDQEFLRSSLAPRAYRKVQRERILIAMQYVRCAATNAAILIRIGESQSRTTSAEVQTRAKDLIDECVRLRMICLVALLTLCVSFLFPQQNVSLMDLVSKYERMSDSLSLLSMSTDPLLASRVKSWI